MMPGNRPWQTEHQRAHNPTQHAILRTTDYLVEVFRLLRTTHSVPRQLSEAEGHAGAAAHVGLVLLRGQGTSELAPERDTGRRQYSR